MTRNKDLKRTVRARMAKTGEKYTAARAHLFGAMPASTTGRGGVHGETAALRGMLDAAGLRDPRTGAAFSEALLLGIGGGLGAAYVSFEYAGRLPHLYVGTRVGHQHPYTAEFATVVCERLGVAIEQSETGGATRAAANLTAALDAAGCAIAWVDMASLPYWCLEPDKRGAVPHVVLVASIVDGAATVYDYSARPFTLTVADLAAARARQRKAKHRLLSVAHGAAVGNLTGGVRAGLAACVESLRDGALVRRAAGNFGLAALQNWARRANNRRDKRGWPNQFAPGARLYVGLRQAYFWIEASGTGGGGFRPMYAAFLDDAATIVHDPALADVAADYRALGEQWTALARAMLRDDVPLLAQTRELLEHKRAAMIELGPGSVGPVRAANARLAELEASAADQLAGDATELYADIAARVADIFAAETAAVDRLDALV